MSSKRLSKTDFIILALVLATAIAGVFLMNTFTHNGYIVRISQKGEVVEELFLEEEEKQEFVVKGENGEKNVVVVDKGLALMKSANCDDKLCVKKGGVEYIGESIVCLPNDVVVEIVEDNSIEESPF